jgi:N-acetylglucosaminyldiphosphoundecaprenol N-acetyl-beta-D-mannosaminyltransferase
MAKCVCPLLGPGPTVNRVPIAPLSMAQTLERVQLMLDCPATHVVNHVPADVTVHARRNGAFRAAVAGADLNVADGMGVVWGCRALGYPEVRERVYGPDFMKLMTKWGEPSGLRHFLLGGTEHVLDQLTARLKAEHPGIQIAGTNSPPFRPLTADDLAEIAGLINKKGPDVIWVGLGTPKQQLIAAQLRPLVDVRVILTVGAAFDFLAGVKPQAPRWMQDRGLEWLFRLGTEPRRLAGRYVVGNPRFVIGILTDKARRSRRTN